MNSPEFCPAGLIGRLVGLAHGFTVGLAHGFTVGLAHGFTVGLAVTAWFPPSLPQYLALDLQQCVLTTGQLQVTELPDLERNCSQLCPAKLTPGLSVQPAVLPGKKQCHTNISVSK